MNRHTSFTSAIFFAGHLLLLVLLTGPTAAQDVTIEEESGATPVAKYGFVKTCFENLREGIDKHTLCTAQVVEALAACEQERRAEGLSSEETVPACRGTIAEACLKSAYARTTYRSAHCLEIETDVWEIQVQKSYLHLFPKISGSARKQMSATHLAWKTYMDERCTLRQTVLNAPDALIEVADCRLGMMGQRVEELRRLERYLTR